MILAVLDTSVFVAAVGWRGAAYRVIVAAARRKVRLAVTSDILTEYGLVARRVGVERNFLERVDSVLGWVERSALRVEPAPLGKRRSRDLTDDKFLASALSAGAQYVVSYDHDLLSLGKPFGVSIVTPDNFLRIVNATA